MPHPKAGYMDAIFFLPQTNFFLASRGEPYMTLFSLFSPYGLQNSLCTLHLCCSPLLQFPYHLQRYPPEASG